MRQYIITLVTDGRRDVIIALGYCLSWEFHFYDVLFQNQKRMFRQHTANAGAICMLLKTITFIFRNVLFVKAPDNLLAASLIFFLQLIIKRSVRDRPIKSRRFSAWARAVE